jgi:hypothetical protein
VDDTAEPDSGRDPIGCVVALATIEGTAGAPDRGTDEAAIAEVESAGSGDPAAGAPGVGIDDDTEPAGGGAIPDNTGAGAADGTAEFDKDREPVGGGAIPDNTGAADPAAGVPGIDIEDNAEPEGGGAIPANTGADAVSDPVG